MYLDSFCVKIIPAQFCNMAANKEADPEMNLFVGFIRNTEILNTEYKFLLLQRETFPFSPQSPDLEAKKLRPLCCLENFI